MVESQSRAVLVNRQRATLVSVFDLVADVAGSVDDHLKARSDPRKKLFIRKCFSDSCRSSLIQTNECGRHGEKKVVCHPDIGPREIPEIIVEKQSNVVVYQATGCQNPPIECIYNKKTPNLGSTCNHPRIRTPQSGTHIIRCTDHNDKKQYFSLQKDGLGATIDAINK